MRKLRALFYGLTHEHASGKLETLRRMDGIYEIAGVVDDRTTATRPNFADHPANPDGFRVISAEEALALDGIDVAFIETTNADLMTIARIFADRGVPMHCDKPCGESMEPYRSIVETCRRKNLPFQIGYMYRGNPALKFARNAVHSGWLGKVGFIEADMRLPAGRLPRVHILVRRRNTLQPRMPPRGSDSSNGAWAAHLRSADDRRRAGRSRRKPNERCVASLVRR